MQLNGVTAPGVGGQDKPLPQTLGLSTPGAAAPHQGWGLRGCFGGVFWKFGFYLLEGGFGELPFYLERGSGFGGLFWSCIFYFLGGGIQGGTFLYF